MFVARLRATHGIKSAPGYLGGIIWVIAMIGYAVLAKNEMSDPIIFILISAVIPLVYLINIAVILLSKRYIWKDPTDKRAAGRFAWIILAVIVFWIIGLILV